MLLTIVIFEELITFVRLERVTAAYIVNSILQVLEAYDLSLDGLRGQRYDGASNLSGEKVGVQKIF